MIFRKKLADPQESCGSEIPREITASRVRRTVWWPRGVVKEVFVTEIRPELNIVLEHTGLGYADIFLSVFMIGSRPNTTVPTIMLSCLSRSVRDEAVRAIKGSNVLQDHPEYNFGASALPLNEPVPSQSLGSPSHSSSVIFQMAKLSNDNHQNVAPLDMKSPILADDPQPNIGRRLVLADSDGNPLRCATGGVILRIGDSYYQRTVGHIDEKKEDNILPPPLDDLDYCYLDGDTDSEDEGAGRLPDHEVTSRGSLSPIPEGLPFGGSSDTESDPDAVMTDAPASDSSSADNSSAGSTRQSSDQDPQSDGHLSGVLQRCPTLVNIGQLRHHSRDGNNAYLDYGLVLLNCGFNLQSVNKVEVQSGGTNSHLRVRTIAQIKDMERDIIVVTASNGTTCGKLIPSALFLRSSSHPYLEELFVVQLQGQILNGDCGADVIDAHTGDLYGHIFRGCAGTQIAYIRAATDVFEDIRQRLGAPVIVAQDDAKVEQEQSESSNAGSSSGSRSHGTSFPAKASFRTSPASNVGGPVLVACPFAKRDFITYRDCEKCELESIKDLERHLEKRHLVLVCPRCRCGFATQDRLNGHLVEGCDVQSRQDPEGMTRRQYDILRHTRHREVSPEDQWYFIWDTLFPGTPRPQTVYKDQSLDLSEIDKIFEDFGDQQIRTLTNQVPHDLEDAMFQSPYDRALFSMNRGLLGTDTLQRAAVFDPTFSWSKLPHQHPPHQPPPLQRPSLHPPPPPYAPAPPPSIAHREGVLATATGDSSVSAVSSIPAATHSTGLSYDSGYYSTSSANEYRGPSRLSKRSALGMGRPEKSQLEDRSGPIPQLTKKVPDAFPMAAYGPTGDIKSPPNTPPQTPMPMAGLYHRDDAR